MVYLVDVQRPPGARNLPVVLSDGAAVLVARKDTLAHVPPLLST